MRTNRKKPHCLRLLLLPFFTPLFFRRRRLFLFALLYYGRRIAWHITQQHGDVEVSVGRRGRNTTTKCHNGTPSPILTSLGWNLRCVVVFGGFFWVGKNGRLLLSVAGKKLLSWRSLPPSLPNGRVNPLVAEGGDDAEDDDSKSAKIPPPQRWCQMNRRM